MKKIITIGMLVATLAGTSAFGQGYFAFSSGKSQAWDGFSTAGSSHLGASVNVAFLWATGTPIPVVDAFLASTPITGNNTTTEPYTVAQAWTAILSDPNYHVAIDATTANSGNPAVALTSATGAINYNGASSFGVTGTTPGTIYSLFEISWNSAFATPALAQSNGSAVGWGSVFSYTPAVSTGTPPSMPGLEPQFGTFIPAPVPEPSTMALAGLGGLAALLFRRRK